MHPRATVPYLAALAGALAITSGLFAENRFYVPDATLPVGDETHTLEVRGDNDATVLGYSVGLRVDPALVTIVGASLEGTVAAAVPEGADFFEYEIVPEEGVIGVGSVFDTDGDFSNQKLDPGTDRVFVSFDVTVAAESAGEATMSLEPVTVHDGRPEVHNVLTNGEGLSIRPDAENPDMQLALEPGTLTIVDFAPAIESLADNSGEAGQVFTITGANFDRPGLSVTVCDAVADADVVDASTLEVTAPECAEEGFVPVEVCTDFGCDTDAEGFEYVVDGEEGIFLRGDTDDSGGLDLTDGIRILNYLFLGDEPARCLDAMDTDDSGAIDLTDGVRIFNFLFVGGDAPLPPFPEEGTDPTPDGLAPCAS